MALIESGVGATVIECDMTVAREVWRDYYVDASAIVFIVDSFDRNRFPEAKRELDSLLMCEELKKVPIVVLGNKVDLQYAASELELRQALGLTVTSGKNTPPGRLGEVRPIEVFMCSIVHRSGYPEGFRWMAQYI